jgi:polygalacturonase
VTNSIRIDDYGAVPDGETLNTAAIQEAIQACHAAGGGQVVCGPGRWVTGSVELKSGVELHLAPGCRIEGSFRLADYDKLVADGFHPELAPEQSAHGLIWASDAEDIAITGSGTIDGTGLAFYDTDGVTGKLEKPDTPRPRIGMFYRCRNIRILDTHFIDSPCWTLWLMQCEGATIRGITVTGNRRLRNVDGIDLDACRDVTVSDCRMDTEDDCVAIRAIQHLYDAPAVCENVVVTNCVLASSCQGVRVGCPGDGVIRNITFSNLVINSQNNGINFDNPHRYLPSGKDGSADVSNIHFSNIVVNCAGNPIRLFIEEGIALPRLSDLSFSDFKIRSGAPCLVQGSKETTIRNVRFSNVQINTSGEDAILCRECQGIGMTGVTLSNGAEG